MQELEKTVTDERRQELRAFLRSRRARLSPAEAQLPSNGRRRAHGLRREDVAELAGISVGWYGQFEVGRATHVSAAVVDSIAHALRLDGTETEYLFHLCGLPDPPRNGTAVVDPTVSTAAQAILRTFAGPGFVMNRYYDVLCANEAAREMLDVRIGANNVREIFFNPARRAIYLDWDDVARTFIAQMRMYSVNVIDDPQFERLVAEMRARSAEFARIWDAGEVAVSFGKTARVRYRANVLRLSWTVFPVRENVLVLISPADDESAERMATFVAELRAK